MWNIRVIFVSISSLFVNKNLFDLKSLKFTRHAKIISSNSFFWTDSNFKKLWIIQNKIYSKTSKKGPIRWILSLYEELQKKLSAVQLFLKRLRNVQKSVFETTRKKTRYLVSKIMKLQRTFLSDHVEFFFQSLWKVLFIKDV